MAEPKDLYVVTEHLHVRPTLEVWPLDDETPGSFFVKFQGGRKVFRKSSSRDKPGRDGGVSGIGGRRFFVKAEDAYAHLRSRYADLRDKALREEARMRVVLALSAADLRRYARGDEAVADAVERQVRALTDHLV